MSSSRVDKGRTAQGSQPTNQGRETPSADPAKASGDIAALDDLVSTDDDDAAASFARKEAGTRTLVPDREPSGVPEALRLPAAPEQVAFRIDIEGLAPELSGGALEVQGLAADAGELHPALGELYAGASESLTQAAEHASAGEALPASARVRDALGRVSEGISFIDSALGGAPAAIPVLGSIVQLNRTAGDVERVVDAVREAPESARQLVGASTTLRAELQDVPEKIRAAWGSLEQGSLKSIESMAPGESRQISYAREAGIGVGVGGQSVGVRIGRKRDGALVVESETKFSFGAGKRIRDKPVSLGDGGALAATGEATAKGESTIKIQWSATDAADARARAVRLGAGQLLSDGVTSSALELTHSREHLQSVEVTGTAAMEIAAKLGLPAAHVAGGVGVERNVTLKFESVAGQGMRVELTREAKLKGEAIARYGAPQIGLKGSAAAAEISIASRQRIDLAAAVDLQAVLGGDLGSLRTKGALQDEVVLKGDGRVLTHGEKFEATLPRKEAEEAWDAMNGADLEGAWSALRGAPLTVTMSSYRRSTVGAELAADAKAAEVTVAMKYDVIAEGEPTTRKAALHEVMRALVAGFRESDETEQQLAAGRSLVR